jgi:SAM-dependent methyltransferase
MPQGKTATVRAGNPTPMPMQRMQESVYRAGFDYRRGSPHLSHIGLYDRLLDHLRQALDHAYARTDADTVLEIGGGHGGFTEPMLAWGYRVTATEMSRPSIEHLQQAYARNPNFSAAFDADGSLSSLGNARYSAIVSVSVLHHIPDYRRAIRQAVADHLTEGGSFISFQDPLWYPGTTRSVRVLVNLAYLSWRLFQGRYGEGLRTRYRRLRGIYDDTTTADTVEYHVVRQGVDQTAIVNDLKADFDECTLITYWSTQSGFWQLVGELADMRNTFGVIASGYHPPRAKN